MVHTEGEKMTIEELKKLDETEQKHLYAVFWSAHHASKLGSPYRAKYKRVLNQLKEIFGLDSHTHQQWLAECATRELVIVLMLDTLLLEAA